MLSYLEKKTADFKAVEAKFCRKYQLLKNCLELENAKSRKGRKDIIDKQSND